jgi:hypothetical protein
MDWTKHINTCLARRTEMRSVQSDLIAAKAGAILMSASNIPLLPTRTQANGNRLLEIFLPDSDQGLFN